MQKTFNQFSVYRTTPNCKRFFVGFFFDGKIHIFLRFWSLMTRRDITSSLQYKYVLGLVLKIDKFRSWLTTSDSCAIGYETARFCHRIWPSRCGNFQCIIHTYVVHNIYKNIYKVCAIVVFIRLLLLCDDCSNAWWFAPFWIQSYFIFFNKFVILILCMLLEDWLTIGACRFFNNIGRSVFGIDYAYDF